MAGVTVLALATGSLVQANPDARLEFFGPKFATDGAPRASGLLPFDPSAALLLDKKVVGRVELAPNLHFEIAQSVFNPSASNFDAPQSFALPTVDLPALDMDRAEPRDNAAALDWSLSDWGGVSLKAENLIAPLDFGREFATPATPYFNSANLAMPFSNTANTSTVGLAAHMQLGSGWVTSFSYDVGVTQLDLKPVAAFAENPTAQGRSYTVAIAKHGLFGDADTLKLSVSRPSDEFMGNLNLGDVGFAGPIDLLSSYHRITLPGDSSETDVGLGYVTTFFGGALALQANAGYQMNVAGQSGENSLTVLSRAKINF
jgi:hypothetical protein